MAKNNIDRLYDLSLYPDCAPINDFERLSQLFEDHNKQFLYFRDKMLPDVYNKLYDLQKRYNDMAVVVKEIDGKLYDHLSPGD